MKYTKTFKDVETGSKYYVTECCFDKMGNELRHLVLVGADNDDVVEVSIDYEGVIVKKVSYVYGNYMEIGVEEFDERFIEVK